MDFVKDIRNHQQPLNPHQNTKVFKQKCLGYSSKRFNMRGYHAQAKINVFTDSNCCRLLSY